MICIVSKVFHKLVHPTKIKYQHHGLGHSDSKPSSYTHLLVVPFKCKNLNIVVLVVGGWGGMQALADCSVFG